MAGNPFAAIGEAELGPGQEDTRHCPAGNAKDENEERPWDGNKLLRAVLRLGARNALYTIRRTSEQSKQAKRKASEQANKRTSK